MVFPRTRSPRSCAWRRGRWGARRKVGAFAARVRGYLLTIWSCRTGTAGETTTLTSGASTDHGRRPGFQRAETDVLLDQGSASPDRSRAKAGSTFVSRMARSAMVRSARCRLVQNIASAFHRPVRVDLLSRSSRSSAVRMTPAGPRAPPRPRHQLFRWAGDAPSPMASSGHMKFRRAHGPSRSSRCRASSPIAFPADPETDAADVARQPIQVFGHDLDGVGAIGLESAHRRAVPIPVAVQEDHRFSHGSLLGPGCEKMLAARTAPDTVDFARRSGVASMTSSTFSPKRAHELLHVNVVPTPRVDAGRGTSRCHRSRSGRSARDRR